MTLELLEMERTAAPTKSARGPCLLNVKHTKDYIRQTAARIRPGSPFGRISDEALLMLEYKLKKIIDGNIRAHHCAKTFRDVI